MKILFILENYLPTKNGGIENYTHWLAGLLKEKGYAVHVAYLSAGEADQYVYEGIGITKLVNGLNSFEALLKDEHFDICHFQEYSAYGGIELNWIAVAKQHCKKVFFTFHLPYLTCYKGDFRFEGKTDCNHFSSASRCVHCILSEKMHSKQAADFAGFANSGLKLLGFPSLTQKLERSIILKHETLDGLLNTCSRVFIYAGWFKEILADNGYAHSSITMIPYKTKTAHERGRRPGKESGIKNRILFVGRIEPAKGLHLLCEAMAQLDRPGLSLDVYGNIVDEAYFEKCVTEYSFNYKKTVSRQALLAIFSLYDFIILPSVFTEMNSLVIRDAFFEELPAIVSSAKGNVGAVTHEQNGFIFKYGDPADLRKTLTYAYTKLKEGWRGDFSYPDRSAEDKAEILSYYSN
jgi:glycosyltransferase involved in cell wall biosynthesis